MNGYKFVTDTLKSKKEAPQQDTPTITLLKNRGDKRVEADGIFRLNYKVYNMKRQAVVDVLRSAADKLDKEHAERFCFEFTIEE